jgi:hypothetical protein
MELTSSTQENKNVLRASVRIWKERKKDHSAEPGVNGIIIIIIIIIIIKNETGRCGLD